MRPRPSGRVGRSQVKGEKRWQPLTEVAQGQDKLQQKSRRPKVQCGRTLTHTWRTQGTWMLARMGGICFDSF